MLIPKSVGVWTSEVTYFGAQHVVIGTHIALCSIRTLITSSYAALAGESVPVEELASSTVDVLAYLGSIVPVLLLLVRTPQLTCNCSDYVAF